jgi:hypothetical protein
MRTLIATFAAAVLLSAAGVASARDFDPAMDPNTSLTALPMHSTSASNRAQTSHMKKETTVPAKYDSSFPVRDRQPLRHEHSI